MTKRKNKKRSTKHVLGGDAAKGQGTRGWTNGLSDNDAENDEDER